MSFHSQEIWDLILGIWITNVGITGFMNYGIGGLVICAKKKKIETKNGKFYFWIAFQFLLEALHLPNCQFTWKFYAKNSRNTLDKYLRDGVALSSNLSSYIYISIKRRGAGNLMVCARDLKILIIALLVRIWVIENFPGYTRIEGAPSIWEQISVT